MDEDEDDFCAMCGSRWETCECFNISPEDEPSKL